MVSALRSASGASYQILLAVRLQKIKIALSVSLVMEYEAVLLRRGIIPSATKKELRDVIDALCRLGHHQKIFYAWRPFLSDPNDDHVLELALAAGANYIITHNIQDFAGTASMGIQAITPAQALHMIQ